MGKLYRHEMMELFSSKNGVKALLLLRQHSRSHTTTRNGLPTAFGGRHTSTSLSTAPAAAPTQAIRLLHSTPKPQSLGPISTSIADSGSKKSDFFNGTSKIG